MKTSSMFWVRYEVNTCFQFEGDLEENRTKLAEAMKELLQRQPGVGGWKVVDEQHVEVK